MPMDFARREAGFGVPMERLNELGVDVDLLSGTPASSRSTAPLDKPTGTRAVIGFSWQLGGRCRADADKNSSGLSLLVGVAGRRGRS